jgi:hypothetical protein
MARKYLAVDYEFKNECKDGLAPGIIPATFRILRTYMMPAKEPVIIKDWDLRGITIVVDGQEYYIRLWNIHEDKEKQTETVEWTLSKILKSRKAVRLTGGTAIITFKEMEEFKKKYPCVDED